MVNKPLYNDALQSCLMSHCVTNTERVTLRYTARRILKQYGDLVLGGRRAVLFIIMSCNVCQTYCVCSFGSTKTF